MKERIKNYYDYICGLAQEYKSKGSTETAEGLSIAADALESHFPFICGKQKVYKKIDYMVDDIEGCITPCPHSEGDDVAGIFFVGSSACYSCGYCMSNDIVCRYVKCNHP